MVAAVACLGCGKTDPASAAPEAASATHATHAPDARADAGLLFVSTRILAPTPAGFTPCTTSDVAPPMSDEEREGWKVKAEKPPASSLHALGTSVSKTDHRIVFTRAGARPGRILLGEWAEVVHTTRPALDEHSAAAASWDSTYGLVVDAIYPRASFVAYAGEDDAKEASSFGKLSARIFLVAEGEEETARVARERGKDALEAVACSQLEGPFHRAAYRVVEGGVTGPLRRILLAASVNHGDTTGVAYVDQRILGGVAGGTLVVACLYQSLSSTKWCDALAASTRR